jgi:hypothetical protein
VGELIVADLLPCAFSLIAHGCTSSWVLRFAFLASSSSFIIV